MRKSDVSNLFDQLSGIDNPEIRFDMINVAVKYLGGVDLSQETTEVADFISFYLNIYSEQLLYSR